MIGFLSAKGVKDAEIHSQISESVRGENMRDDVVWKWVRAFKDDRTNVNYEE